MENATKGLMIAGAILIAIVLIGIGVMLVTSAQDVITDGSSQMDETAIQTFNSKFLNYEGAQKGSNINALINNVNTNNLTANREGTHAEKGINVLFDTAIGATNITGNEDTYDTVAATRAKSKINSGRTYYVAIGYSNTGLVNEIGIALVVDNNVTAAAEAAAGLLGK